MADFNNILDSVSSQKTRALHEDESVRSLSNAPLVAGISKTPNEVLAESQTIRISSGGDRNFETGKNQSIRSQVPPATDNKIPRIYGDVTTGGVIVDAHKLDGNTLMYAFVLSETDPDRYDFSDTSKGWDVSPYTIFSPGIFRDNDYFEWDIPSYDAQAENIIDLETDTSRNVLGANIQVRIWAGNSDAQCQIFPAVPLVDRVNAYDMFPTWDANVTMENTVFAIVQVGQYENEAANIDIKNFGTWKFNLHTEGYHNATDVSRPIEIKHLDNPAWALKDYLTSSRYGAGLTEADLDLPSFQEWADVCDEKVNSVMLTPNARGSAVSISDYTFVQGGVTYYVTDHWEKFRCNGIINPGAPVVENINAICSSGMGTLTYDNKTGLFRVLSNRIMSVTEQENAFHFTADNIVSEITVSTTDLYSLFNFAEVTFPNYLQEDESDTVFVSAPDTLPNEPTSGTDITQAFNNRRFRAANIGNIQLKQSRVSTVATFTADHSSMTVDVGDFVKVTDQLKGWSEKYFRVVRIQEQESSGAVTCNFTLAEYNSAVFDEILYLDATDNPSGAGFGETRNHVAGGVPTSSPTFDSIYADFVYVMDQRRSGGSLVPSPSLWIHDNPTANVNADHYWASNVTYVGQQYPPGTSYGLTNGYDPAFPVGTWPYLTVRAGTDAGTTEPKFPQHEVTISNGTFSTRWSSSPRVYGTDDYRAMGLWKLPRTGTFTVSLAHINPVIDPDASTLDPEKQLRVPYERTSTPYVTGVFTINDRTCTGADMTDTYGENSQITDTWPTGIISENTTVTLNKMHDVVGHKSGMWTWSGSYEINYTSLKTGFLYDDQWRFNITPQLYILFVENPGYQQSLGPTGSQTYQSGYDTHWVRVPAQYVFNSPEAISTDPSNVFGVTNTISTEINMDAAYYGLDSTWYASRVISELEIDNWGINNPSIANASYTITNQTPLWRNS